MVLVGDKIFFATNVRRKSIHPIYRELAESLSEIESLRYIKIYNGRIRASNRLSEDKKKDPVIEIGGKDLVGVELLLDINYRTIQFFSITSSIKGTPPDRTVGHRGAPYIFGIPGPGPAGTQN